MRRAVLLRTHRSIQNEINYEEKKLKRYLDNHKLVTRVAWGQLKYTRDIENHLAWLQGYLQAMKDERGEE